MDASKVDDIEARVTSAIRDAVNYLCAEYQKYKTPEWTRRINAAVKGVADPSVSVCCHQCDDEVTAEWLWDMTWLVFDKSGDQPLLDIPLAMECEWNTQMEAILYDFRRLLVGKAGLRVMVCETSKESSGHVFDRLLQEIREFRGTQKGDRYLLACFCYGASPARIDFKSHTA